MGKRLLELCPDTRGIRCGVKGVWLLSIAFLLVTDLWGAGSNVPEDRSQPPTVTIRGSIHDKITNSPVAGVTVIDVETGIGGITQANGEFSLSVPVRERVLLKFSFVGMKTVEMNWTGQSSLHVVMEEETEEIGEIVITGFFERKAESFTGSVATYDQEQLRTIGGGNVLQSLSTLDPSFRITPNDLYGSDPNRLPEINIRGKNGIVDPRESYTVDPNQPLFILDGFQVDLEEIVKLNVNRIESITLLKDAASTAIYGSKAANGVLVVETVKPQPGKIRVDYGGSFSLDFPDFTDYNLMNAQEKIRFELESGAYNWNGDAILTQGYQGTIYSDRLNRVKSGVDTYWLKQPVRTGFTHKHNVYVSGGDQSLLYGLGVDYANTEGAMKGSGNDYLGTSLNLQYRINKFRFSNKLTVNYTESWDPGVSFAAFAETNPYNAIPENKYGEKYLEDFPTIYGASGLGYTVRTANPFFNDSLNHIDENQRLLFRDNFYAEWRPINGMKIEGKFSLELNRNKTEYFKSPYHTDYSDIVVTERGQYTKSTTDRTKYSGQLIASYLRVFNGVHYVNAVGTFEAESDKRKYDAFTAIGFTDDLIPYPSFAGSYDTGLPQFNLTESRKANYFINANYIYDQRYVAEFTLSRNGSSNFGRQNLFATTWSAGVTWNMQHENFLRDKVESLRLRFTVGEPGNNNVSYQTETTYKYYSKSSLFGNALYINQFGSYGLEWQKTLKLNAGVDFVTRDRSFSLTADIYQSITDPMIIRLDVPFSTGRKNLQTNMGRNNIKGLDFKMNYNIINRSYDRFYWAIGLTGSTEKSKFTQMGDLTDLNNEFRELASLKRYANGYSEADIWAVRSAGIDPSTGDEVYIKKDGTYSFTYDSSDEVAVGSTQPVMEGVLSSSFNYKGWNAAIYVRYIFGADEMNTALFRRIEGLDRTAVLSKNQDKRALYDRWKNPGDIAKYKRINDLDSDSYLTDRFLQRKQWVSGESISVGYDFVGDRWLQKVHLQNLSVKLIVNNIFHFWTIKQERGIEYPYTRTASLTINASF